jgi:polyhydroxyalkanoate synthesis repressor PhaR
MAEARVIKRYANRKLYDTQHSRYVTLDQISEMIRAGDEVKIVDNKTKEDLTSVTLAQIIFEEEKKQRSFMPLGAMRNIIQNGGEWFAEAQRRVTSVLPFKREAGDEDARGGGGRGRRRHRRAAQARAGGAARVPHWIDEQQRALDEWQKRVDNKVRTAIGGISPFAGLHKDVRALSDRIAELEAKLQEMADVESRE